MADPRSLPHGPAAAPALASTPLPSLSASTPGLTLSRSLPALPRPPSSPTVADLTFDSRSGTMQLSPNPNPQHSRRTSSAVPQHSSFSDGFRRPAARGFPCSGAGFHPCTAGMNALRWPRSNSAVCVWVNSREMALLCPSLLVLTGSRSASSHSARKNSRLLPAVSVVCGSEEFRGGVKATVRSLRRESVASGSRVAMAVFEEVSSTAEAAPRPFGVLFVCLGNICRSPTAEAVFRDVVEKRKLNSLFNIDSAGTIDYHEGNPADPRMKAAALRRGVKLTSISRPIRPSDFDEFDLILAMDKSNRADILTAYESWNRRAHLPAGAKEKVKLMCSYSTRHNVDEVPDPYYGGPAGFEKVLDLLEDACEGLLASIQELQVKDRKVNEKTSP